MIDIVVIILYILVITKALLRAFSWIQRKFKIYGGTEESIENQSQVDNPKQDSRVLSEESSSKKDLIRQESSSNQQSNINKISSKESSDLKENAQTIQENEKSFSVQRSQLQQKSGKGQPLPQQIIIQQPVSQVSPLQTVSSQLVRQSYQILRQQIESLKRQKQQLKNQNKSVISDLESEKKKTNKLSEQIIGVKNQYESSIMDIRKQYITQIQQHHRNLKTRDQLQKLNQQIQLTADGSQSQIIIEKLREKAQLYQKKYNQEIEIAQKLKKQIQSLPKSEIMIQDISSHPQFKKLQQKVSRYESTILPQSRSRSGNRNQLTPKDSRLKQGSRIQRRSLIDPGQGQGQPLSQSKFLAPQQKIFILGEINKINRIKKTSVKTTKLVFYLDKLRPINPHQYIDSVKNILIVIQLTNKKVLAGFSEAPFVRDDVRSLAKKSNKALIMDVTNKKSFSNTSSENAIIYDENALIWGNEQLLIKNDEPSLLYSNNFGTAEGVYGNGNYSLAQLFESNRSFERINQYEIYGISMN